MDFLLCVYQAGHNVYLNIPLSPSYRLPLFYQGHCLNVSGGWAAVIFVSVTQVSRGSSEHSKGVCVFVWEEEGGCLYLTWGSHGFLLIGLVQRPGANRVTGEKYCEKNPKRHFCLNWDIWQRSCEHTESSSGGSKWRGWENERGREREMHVSPKLMRYPQIKW